MTSDSHASSPNSRSLRIAKRPCQNDRIRDLQVNSYPSSRSNTWPRQNVIDKRVFSIECSADVSTNSQRHKGSRHRSTQGSYTTTPLSTLTTLSSAVLRLKLQTHCGVLRTSNSTALPRRMLITRNRSRYSTRYFKRNSRRMPSRRD
jgi:hypothetical protein